MRRFLRIAAWNVALAAAGLALIAAAGEIYLRAQPNIAFSDSRRPIVFDPDAGILLAPNALVHYTNGLDFWQTARANSLGFLDREPLNPQDAAASCHVAVIGDSFVEANEVPIADKFHIRLEQLAAERLPGLEVTASAWGRRKTGQVNQIPFYDHFARALRPNLIVLVFVSNDFMDNSVVLQALLSPYGHPEKSPFAAAYKQEDGGIELRPPHPSFESTDALKLNAMVGRGADFTGPVLGRALSLSYFANWMRAKWTVLFPAKNIGPNIGPLDVPARARELSRLPCCRNVLDGWTPSNPRELNRMLRHEETIPPVFQDAVDYTAFALDEWKARADRDGAQIVILSAYIMNTRGRPLFDRMNALAQERGLPVIDQYAYIIRQGRKIEDARFRHDYHWNADGHLWAAEALMEWIERNQDVCGDE